MSDVLRRTFLRSTAGTLAAGAVPWPLGWARTRVRRGADPDGLLELSRAWRERPREERFGLAAAALRRGVSRETLLGSIFHAGIVDVRPRPVGFKLHCVMVVESVFQLMDASAADEALWPLLFNLEDLGRSQESDRREGDWTLPPPPSSSIASEATARAELAQALETWDEERADRAVTSLVPRHDVRSFFALLRPVVGRCFHNLGHKVIFAAHIERVLERIGWSVAEPALRSLIRGLLVRDDVDRTQAHQGALELLPDVPALRAGDADPAASFALFRALRPASVRGAQERLVAALADGASTATVWDALRLTGADLFWRKPALLPVHPVTTTNAFRHTFDHTADERTRALLLLQLAGFLPQFREGLRGLVGLSMDGPGLESLLDEGEGDPDVDALFRGDVAPGAAARALRGPAARARFLARSRQHLFRKGREHHEFKYAAAIHEESARIHPRFAPLLLAPSLRYLPTDAQGNAEWFERARRALG